MPIDTLKLDGFAYSIEELNMWKEGAAVPTPCVRLTFTDTSERDYPPIEIYFGKAEWEEFNRQVNGGVLVPSVEALRRVGI